MVLTTVNLNFFSRIGANLHFSRESEFKDLWQTRACELVDFIKETVSVSWCNHRINQCVASSRWISHSNVLVHFCCDGDLPPPPVRVSYSLHQRVISYASRNGGLTQASKTFFSTLAIILRFSLCLLDLFIVAMATILHITHFTPYYLCIGQNFWKAFRFTHFSELDSKWMALLFYSNVVKKDGRLLHPQDIA